MFEFKLADVGEGLHEAEILRWLVGVGDEVRVDQPLVEIQTDKAAVELPSPVAGKIVSLNGAVGNMVRVGETLVVIAGAGRAPAAPAAGAVAAPPAPDASTASPPPGALPAAQTAAVPAPGRRVLAAPAVRRMALAHGVDLIQVPGTGPVGRILPRDVEAFVSARSEAAAAAPPSAAAAAPPAAVPTAAGGEERQPLQGLRRRISERMTEAWQIPHVTAFEDVDATGLVALRAKLLSDAQQQGIKLTYMPLIVKAVLATLRQFPDFQARLDLERKEIVHSHSCHIGFATATDEGLLVPVIHHAERLSVLGLAAEMARLTEQARQRRLSPTELSGSTFTITNFGSYGGTRGTPIINPPEVAILGVGAIARRPWVVDDQVVPRPILPLSLSFDHRVIDGHGAGHFLIRLMAYLTTPELLLLEMV